MTSPRRTRLVHDQAGDRALHVVDLDHGAVRQRDDAGVGELAAALGVERRAVEHELDLVPAPAADATSPSTSRPRTVASRDDLVVAGELGGRPRRRAATR